MGVIHQFRAASACRHFILAGMLLLSGGLGFAATLTHRYSFDTDASDSVGGANGTLQGVAYITNGAVVLNGSNSWVQLPNDLFTNYTSASFEIWFTDASINSSNASLYAFAGANGSMNYQLFGIGGYSPKGALRTVILSAPAVGGTNHVIWTQDGTAQTAALYVNGQLTAQNTNFFPTPMKVGSTTNNCIGGVGFVNTVSNFNGSIFEFRSYQDVLSPLDAAVLDAFGPDQAQSDPGILQAIRVVVPTPTGPGALFRAGVFADFSGITNVNISTQPDLVLTSDNTNVIAIAPDKRLQTVALGTADITAIWQGFSNTETITVAVPQDVTLVHRYSFNELTNDWIVHDSAGRANGRLFSPPIPNPSLSPTAAFTGNGELSMTGYPYHGGYVSLPGGLISSLSEVSIEAWVDWTPGNVSLTYNGGSWQRIFDFGSWSGGRGVSYLFLTPATDNETFGTLQGNPVLEAGVSTNSNTPGEFQQLNWTNTLPTNVLSCVVVTYSPVRGVMKMYLNGALIETGTPFIPLSQIVDTNDWLGRSQYSQDAWFFGYYDEFRIYSGLLSGADVAADYAAGPDAVGADDVLHEFPSGNNSLTISWGPSVTNLVLQTSPVLGDAAVWTQVTNLPTLQNGRFNVIVPISDDAAFYRLHAP